MNCTNQRRCKTILDPLAAADAEGERSVPRHAEPCFWYDPAMQEFLDGTLGGLRRFL